MLSSVSPLLLLLVMTIAAHPHPLGDPRQRILVPQTDDQIHRVPSRPPGDFDAAANSVGVLFTQSTANAEDEDVVHLWLPLGKKINAHEHPILPGHPLSARVTTLIHTSPQLASTEALDRVQCDLWTYRNMTPTRGQELERWKVSFARHDGTVFFGKEGERWWLGGKEVESVECF